MTERMKADQPLGFRPWTHIPAAIALCLCRFILAIVPLRWVCLALGLTPRQATAQPADERTAQIAAGTRRTISYLSGFPALGLCVPQCIAAAAMLRARGVRSTLHFGVLKTGLPDEPLRAHAWLTVGQIVVAGDGARFAFVELNPQHAPTTS